jgi:hypothetical protein
MGDQLTPGIRNVCSVAPARQFRQTCGPSCCEPQQTPAQAKTGQNGPVRHPQRPPPEPVVEEHVLQEPRSAARSENFTNAGVRIWRSKLKS